jgi:hypothetical protein
MKWTPTLRLIGAGFVVITVAGCAAAAPEPEPIVGVQESASTTANTNGRGGTMPAFYDDQLFTINFKELPPGGERAVLANNKSINTIYQSDGCMPGGEMFVSVLDAIQGDGFNPLWNEVQVVFDNPSFPCQQITSDTDILNAAAEGNVTLVPTTEVYRCSVIGPNK